MTPVTAEVVSTPKRRIAAALLLASCLLLTPACVSTNLNNNGAVTSPTNVAGRTRSLSREVRVEIFEGVWRAINDNYYEPSFNGVDWPGVREKYRLRVEAAADDFEFYAQIEIMLSELRDGHTTFSPPPTSASPRGGGPRSIGLALAEADGRVVVSEVETNSGAERAGVRAGMTLRAVNGKTVDEHLVYLMSVFAGSSSERDFKARMFSALLYGLFLSYPRKLSLTDFDGREFDVELSPQPIEPPPVLSARRLTSGFGYVKFGSWQSPVEAEFGAALSKMMDAPGLVIDLRGNGGGNTDVLLDIAGNFFPSETFFGAFRTRAGELKKHFTRRHERVYGGAVVILVDETTASASETFSVFMQEAGRAAVVGRQSAGSTLNMIGGERHFKDGGKLLFSTHAYISPSGRNPEGEGVVPDEIVPLAVEDLRRGRDAALEAAERRLAAARPTGG